MHELTICRHILDLLTARAKQDHFECVKTLWLEVGDLAGIELDALRFSFPIAASGTIAANAALEIISVTGKAWCDVCQKSMALKTCFDPCPCCGRYDYQITQGKELKIVKMEVA